MKIKGCIKSWVLLLFLGSQFPAIQVLKAQICQHAADTVYAMNTTGVLYPINLVAPLNNGTPVLTSSPTTAINSNGLGYSSLYGKFYFFNKVGVGSGTPTQFASYDPVSHTLTTLPSPTTANLPYSTSQKIRTGCVNSLGSGYYTINPQNTGAGSTPALYYYNIAAATWTTLTTSFKDPSNVSLNTTFNGLNSGDMSFDGSGNLWIILSNSSQYALYKIAAPVPTTAVASVTAIAIIAPTSTPGSVSFTGMAFNSAGTLYLSTGSGGAAGNNLLYKMTTVAGGLSVVGTLPIDDMGADLTSCVAPLFVLPVSSLLNFAAVRNNTGVELSWNAVEDESTGGYNIEYSRDGASWATIASLEKKGLYTGATARYQYIHTQYAADNNFYRVVQTSKNGSLNITAAKLVNAGTDRSVVTIGPNPAKDVLYIYNAGTVGKSLYQVFDRSGRMLYSAGGSQTQQSIDISHLPKGSYILKISSPAENTVSCQQFIKW